MPRGPKTPFLKLRAYQGRTATWYIKDGSRLTSTGCGASDRASAEKRLAEYILDRYEPERTETRLASLSIADVVNVYLRERTPHVANPSFIIATAEPIIDWWGDKTLADIRGATCRDYVAWRTAQPIKRRKNGATASIATARHDLKTLRAAIQHYHKEHGPLDAVPAVTVPPASPPRERWLTWQEAARLLRAARGNEALARFIVLGLHTGTRSDAVMRLRWLASPSSGYVDFTAGLIYRKGRAERETKKRRPPIAITPALARHLTRWHNADAARGVSHVIHDRGEPLKKFRRSWASAVKRAGLGPDVTAHVLRHTYVTWRLRAGHDPWQVAGDAGMSLDMLQRTYGHHVPRVNPRGSMRAVARKSVTK